ncbi:diguanylate cyclase [Brenneria goodwinii]|uniref:diguanylate cyclase n=1 Tax=Brenneria goodwinii TaxID=1109412 RepID=A0A0G4JVC5_9GAMM|nr:GGDEF domain-containing protein [Brenneria goodwinii]ATA26630.1 diguanylate cyclase [Brenneria goodwinii]MCG8156320.1 GGDEF domain-containing protein [Brenneria goodwinii]MCG8160941.1 GGDEF domain-containing protein [Brenneria goodwinii]MCG8166253.1 GGDEF domain-containing protein [Brenneria goodwinii]MCG8169778.1 GGDEF domain-containing protein [Brenneria goodwinii]
MNSAKYKILELFSHPMSAFIIFGFISFSISVIVIHESNKRTWKVERHDLDSIIKTYESYNSGDVTETDITEKTGRYLSARMRTFAFNTRDVRRECIHRLSTTDLKFNDMTIIRVCQNKLPSIGSFAGKGTLTVIFPILSAQDDDLLGIRIRTTANDPYPSIFDTLSTTTAIVTILCIVLLIAVLGSLLSILTKKYLIELPLTARYDDLTGCLRRDAFFMAANKALSISNFSKRPLCVILIDIDHFKSVNDTLGHSAGDEALRLVADVFKNSFRREDIFGRIGGDEFAIILPNIALNEAYVVAERARSRISEIRSEILGTDLSLTVSIGLVEYQIESEDLIEVMNRADEKLYVAKEMRNTVAK